MSNYKIQPKMENINKGFSYHVSDEMLAWNKKLTIDKRLDWVFETAELILTHQTPEQRALMERIKHQDNGLKGIDISGY